MLYLPKNMPVVGRLRSESIAVEEYDLTELIDGGVQEKQSLLRILFLNIMPQKEVTELDIARVMVHPEYSVQLIPMKIAGQTYKTTPQKHMDTFYTDFEKLQAGDYDGLIITGSPIEHLPFEEVRYWRQLCEIMDWAKTHVHSVLYICWGAQAGLYHHYGIPKYQLPAKVFGIYPQCREKGNLPLFQGMSDEFPMPNSRHTEVRRSDFPENSTLRIVAEGEVTGVSVAIDHDGREIYVTGHLEYEPFTLHNEYMRDVNKGLPIDQPRHYYIGDNPDNGVDFSWKESARLFYRNWLSFYCH